MTESLLSAQAVKIAVIHKTKMLASSAEVSSSEIRLYFWTHGDRISLLSDYADT